MKKLYAVDMSTIKLESVISIFGEVKEDKNVLNPYEIVIEEFEIINSATEELPVEINKSTLDINLDTMLDNRVLSLRHEKINSIFKIQNLIVQGFREFLSNEGFTEIFTPKIMAEGAVGGTEHCICCCRIIMLYDFYGLKLQDFLYGIYLVYSIIK